ncbi:hypothetical protein [Actinocrispum sp. NPDC049592]|uniref:hypothetical protein n=1 Tax=Actinocrispum sp. NPDC049592 TaxID=3154835 RepID=UPI003442C9AA
MRHMDREVSPDQTGSAEARPAGPSPVMLGVGNQAAARLAGSQPMVFAQLWSLGSAIDTAGTVAGAVVKGLVGQELSGSVGVEGDNNPGDMLIVLRLLAAAGYADADLNAAISRFQKEVLHFPHPDGRVDPGGRTLRALTRTHASSSDSGSAAAPAAPGAPAAASAPVAPAAPAPSGPIPADPAAIEAELNRLEALGRKATPGSKGGQQAYEESGPGRAELVEGIGNVRTAINGLTDPAKKAEFFHRVSAIAPFYTQFANTNILHKDVSIVRNSTCNITTVALCLEQMGKSAGDYTGDRHKLEAVERWAEAQTGSEIDSGSRLADFMQLASIVEKLSVGDPTDEQIEKARFEALNHWIATGADPLMVLFRRFGVGTEVIKSPEQDDLTAIGKKYRDGIWKTASARQSLERQGKSGDADVVEAGHHVKDLDEQEEKVDLHGYKQWVKDTYTPILDAGRPVAVGQYYHWTRLQDFNDDYVVIDDVGGTNRLNRKYAWEEARGIGLFAKAVVVKG